MDKNITNKFSTLVCPLCKAHVKLDESAQRLICQSCGESFQIQDDIPIMLASGKANQIDYKIENAKRYQETNERKKYAIRPSRMINKESIWRQRHHFLLPNERVIDIGGGSGIIMEMLQEKTPLEVYALDLSLSSLRERTKKDVRICGDMENLPFKDESFDRAFFFASLHHVINTQKAVEEAKRVIRKGGYIVMREPISLRLLLKGEKIQRVDETEFCFSALHLLNIIKQLGLRAVYCRYQGFFRRFIPKFLPVQSVLFLNLLTDKLDDIFTKIPLLRLLGSSILLVVQK